MPFDGLLTEGQREGWNSDYILALFGVSALGFVLFLILSKYAKTPILNVSLFGNFYFTILSLLNILRSVALFGRVFLLPLFFSESCRIFRDYIRTPARARRACRRNSHANIRRMMDRLRPKFFIFVGFFLFALSNLMFFNLNVSTPLYQYPYSNDRIRLRGGHAQTRLSRQTAMNVVKRDQIGQVSTVLSVSCRLAALLALPCLAL